MYGIFNIMNITVKLTEYYEYYWTVSEYNILVHPFGDLFALFLLPSLPMHASTPIRNDLQYNHLYPYPNHFLTNPPKHYVRGNFPDHRIQILICEALNDPCLHFFFVFPVAPTPQRTHLQSSTPEIVSQSNCKHVLYVHIWRWWEKNSQLDENYHFPETL